MKSRRPGKRLAVQRVPPKKIGNQSYTLTTNNQTDPKNSPIREISAEFDLSCLVACKSGGIR